MKIEMLVAVLALCLGLYHVAAAATGVTQSGEVRHLLSAASEKGERDLTLTWDGNALGGAEGAKLFEALFNWMYGTKVKVNYTPGPSMPILAGKLTLEVAAGRSATTDVFLGSVEHYTPLVNRNVMEEYDYTKLSPRITRGVVVPRNIGVEIYSSMPGIVYNTELVPQNEVPRKLQDVLNPKWKGRIASTEHAAYFDRVAMRPEWGPEKIMHFVSRLSSQVGGLIRVNEVSRIISGEFVMLVLGASQGVRREMAKGAPLGFIIPEDAAAAHFTHMGVPRNSGAPNLAKLFVNMVMSEDGQRLLYKTHFADHHELPGSQSALLFKELGARGVQPLKADVQFIMDHPEMNKLMDEIEKTLRTKPKG